MSRNNLKRFPTAILRRGMAHFHPTSPPNITYLADPAPVENETDSGPVTAEAPLAPSSPAQA